MTVSKTMTAALKLMKTEGDLWARDIRVKASTINELWKQKLITLTNPQGHKECEGDFFFLTEKGRAL